MSHLIAQKAPDFTAPTVMGDNKINLEFSNYKENSVTEIVTTSSGCATLGALLKNQL